MSLKQERSLLTVKPIQTQENLPCFLNIETFADFLSNTNYWKKENIQYRNFFYRTQHIQQLGGYQIYPAGYYADDAPSYFSATTIGIASTEESLIVYRKSENNISSSSCWNVEKSKAALKYYQWIIDEFPMKQQDEQIIQQRLDFDLYTYFSAALNIHQSIQILNCIPVNIWNWKKKLLCLYKFILNSYAKQIK